MTLHRSPIGLATAAALVASFALAPSTRAGDSHAPAATDEAADPPVAATPAPEDKGEGKYRLYWKDGETVFETDGFRAALSNRVQFRWTQQMPHEKVQLAGTTAPGQDIGSFRIRRAKTQLDGWFWRPEVAYELQIGWAGSDSTGGSSVFSGLEDAVLTWDASKKGTFKVKIGQYKVPFGRQELTSSERQQFIERSILSGEFTRSRDVGVGVEGVVARGKLEYKAGIFNGDGRNKATNDNAKYQYDARLSFQPWGDVKYSEADFESKDKLLLAVTGELEQNNFHGATNANDFKNTILGGDVVVKYKGLSLFGEYFNRKREPETGLSFHSNGYHFQAGYFLRRDKLEVAFRYASWDPSDQAKDDDQTEIGAAVTYYLLKHRFKIGGDFRRLEDKIRDVRDKELRVQTQFVF